MVFRELLNRALGDIRGIAADALKYRREHPAVFALAHSYAATHFRREAADARKRGKRVRARWLERLAMWHRWRRRVFKRKARATAEAEECECMLRKLETL